jgi:hypothetical protein
MFGSSIRSFGRCTTNAASIGIHAEGITGCDLQELAPARVLKSPIRSLAWCATIASRVRVHAECITALVRRNSRKCLDGSQAEEDSSKDGFHGDDVVEVRIEGRTGSFGR